MNVDTLGACRRLRDANRYISFSNLFPRYWDEPADLKDISDSALWSEDAFGGNGSGEEMCVSNGPFANLTLRYNVGAGVDSGHCLTRNFTQESFNTAATKYIKECNKIDTYEEAWICWSRNPHNAGHGGTGGIVSH